MEAQKATGPRQSKSITIQYVENGFAIIVMPSGKTMVAKGEAEVVEIISANL